jgi:hypothetical protein
MYIRLNDTKYAEPTLVENGQKNRLYGMIFL